MQDMDIRIRGISDEGWSTTSRLFVTVNSFKKSVDQTFTHKAKYQEKDPVSEARRILLFDASYTSSTNPNHDLSARQSVDFRFVHFNGSEVYLFFPDFLRSMVAFKVPGVRVTSLEAEFGKWFFISPTQRMQLDNYLPDNSGNTVRAVTSTQGLSPATEFEFLVPKKVDFGKLAEYMQQPEALNKDFGSKLPFQMAKVK